MNNQLETIRQACIKANPEIVELKFGCEVEQKGNNSLQYLVIDVFETSELYQYPQVNVVEKEGRKYSDTFDDYRLKIIGRPIRLADVLLAIAPLPAAYSVSSSPEWYIVTHWKLEKDDLTLQSPETIAFLAELLNG